MSENPIFDTRPAACHAPPMWLARAVPDPLTILTDYWQADGDDKGRQWTAMRLRRSQALATARQITSEVGVDNLRLGEVAARSELAVQTLYNLVGDRTALLCASAAEWVRALAYRARLEAIENDSNSILVLLTYFWSSAFTERAYVVNAARGSLVPGSALHDSFISAGVEEIARDLEQLRRRDGLHDAIDIKCLAYQLTITANATIANWLLSPYEGQAFSQHLIHGPGLMLRAALKGCALAQLERGMDRIRVVAD